MLIMRERGESQAVVYTKKELKLKTDCTTLGKGDPVLFPILSLTSCNVTLGETLNPWELQFPQL